ncbi:MAG: hypothetical protein KA436_11610 [Oligoflexales bacterium]|nr:hypothetical protein [Oligoflexales bacterium]
MRLTISKLRQDIFNVFDTVIKTGEPVEVERDGNILLITSIKDSSSKLNRLKKRTLTKEKLANFDHIDWTKEWKP